MKNNFGINFETITCWVRNPNLQTWFTHLCHAELVSASYNRHSDKTLKRVQGDKFAFTLTEVFFHPAEQYRRFAFTLAEVLITLGIIGIVAALTMPSLIAKHQEQAAATKLKKFYSTFSQAYMLAVNEYGTFDTWGLGAPEGGEDENGNFKYSEDYINRVDKFFDMMKPYLKIVHSEKQENGENAYILADGTRIISFWLNTPACIADSNQICGDFYVKIDNKNSTPADVSVSAYGYNVYNFRFFRNKIRPTGSEDIEFERCKNKTNATQCTAWVIYNGNMDYLHCPDKLGWNKARSCKGK